MYVRSLGSGHPVVFLHGMPTNGSIWGPIVERMSAEFRCIVVDLPHDFRDLAAVAVALDEVRRQHGIRKWHLVGHDAGCALAVHYAHRFPASAGRMGLLSPSLFPELKPFYLFEVLRKPILGEMLAPAVNSLFWNVAMPRALAANEQRGRLIAELRGPFSGLRGSWRLMKWLRWGHPAEVLAAMPELLRAIDTPAAIFHGLHDPAVPAVFAQRASELLRHSQLTLLSAGHFLPLHEPAAISRELQRFFAVPEEAETQPLAAAAGIPV
jgi:pimeloyl-ACP methyl ester carboxylesterase